MSGASSVVGVRRGVIWSAGVGQEGNLPHSRESLAL